MENVTVTNREDSECGKEYSIEIGSFDSVIIDKMFGPTIYCNLRIIAMGVEGKWIIEREKTVNNENGEYKETVWEKVCEIDAQESIFG